MDTVNKLVEQTKQTGTLDQSLAQQNLTHCPKILVRLGSTCIFCMGPSPKVVLTEKKVWKPSSMNVVLHELYWSKILLSTWHALPGCCPVSVSVFENTGQWQAQEQGKWDGNFFHLRPQCPAASTSHFIEETLWEVTAPLRFNWNTEHSDSLCLRYMQPCQPLHFFHCSCFIFSVKCSLGSVGQESPANTVVRLVCSMQILLVPIYNVNEKTIVPHQSGYCKAYMLLPKTTKMSGNKLAVFALMVQPF